MIPVYTEPDENVSDESVNSDQGSDRHSLGDAPTLGAPIETVSPLGTNVHLLNAVLLNVSGMVSEPHLRSQILIVIFSENLR